MSRGPLTEGKRVERFTKKLNKLVTEYATLPKEKKQQILQPVLDKIASEAEIAVV